MNKNLLSRILTALIAGTVAVSAIVYSAYGIWFFCVVVSMLGLWEFLSVTQIKYLPYKLTVMVSGLIIWVMALLGLTAGSAELPEVIDKVYMAVCLLVLPILGILALFNSTEKEPLSSLGTSLLGLVYCYLPLFLLFKLSVPESVSDYAFSIPLGILLLTWTLDSFAYFSGRFFGKHPLFPRISPKKTWEGAIGGAICCIAVGVGLNYWFSDTGTNWVIIAFIISVVSQLGDLIESMFKRSRKLKDSGNILPGHGGMLDRFDGIYLSVPFIFLYFSLL